MRKITALLAFAATILSLLAGFTSCEPEVEDNGDFTLCYSDIADIAPSTDFSLEPSWHGGTPESFAIYKITLDGKEISSGCFSIAAESGVISLNNTGSLATGEYRLSISCKAGGKTRRFADLVTISMMKPVPEGIKVEPSVLDVKLSDIIAKSDSPSLPTAQVTTDGNHISILGYKIANVTKDGENVDATGLFAISSKGTISITEGNGNMQPGVYVLDLRLLTHVADETSEEGLFKNSLTINVTSEPLALTYTPDNGKAEYGYAHVSQAPAMKGSLQGLNYTIKKVSKEGAVVSVDSKTGVLTYAASNTLPSGTDISISVSVTNDYGTADFEDVYTVSVVDYISPITAFSYEDKSGIIQASAFSVPVKEIAGGDVTFSFVNLPENLSSLSIDAATGEVSAAKGNDIAPGEYKVTVLAANAKGSMQASFKITVVANPYLFTYVSWGNNLGLTPVKAYASQHEFNGSTESLVLPVVESDLPDGQPVKFSISKGYTSSPTLSIDSKTGEITVARPKNKRVEFAYVTVTCGGSDESAVTKVIPVFFNYPGTVNKVTVRYVPFVFQCNPKTGGRSAAPTITTSSSDKVALDYRRTFNYYDLEGGKVHKNGTPNVTTAGFNFLGSVWTTFFTSINKSVNTGARSPMSWFDNATSAKTTLNAAYTDQNDYAVVINPDKFRDDNGYANGIFFGQQTVAANGGKDPASAAGGFFLIVWLDTDF